MAGFDFSSFFGSNKSSGMGSFNFGDYNLIRNGGYRKLMKSYYSPKKETTSTNKTDKTDKTEKPDAWSTAVDNSGLKKVKKEADGLKKSAEDLANSDMWKQKNGTYDTEKIASAIKSFASEYNDVVTEANKAGNKDVSTQLGFMKSMTTTMSKALSKVGVSVGVDGKLSVDEETLKKADMKDVKALFEGKFSYASDMASKASAISSAAVRNASFYSSDGKFSNPFAADFDKWI